MATLIRITIIALAFLAQSCNAGEDSFNDNVETVEIIELIDNERIFYMTDPLYPSDSKYKEWVELLTRTIEKQLSNSEQSFLIWGGDNLTIDRSFDWQIFQQVRNLRQAMNAASTRAVFVSGNHDYNQRRAFLFSGTDSIRKFSGDKNRVIRSSKIELFLYDANHFEANNYSYDNPVVNSSQLKAYESQASSVCSSRKCVAVIGTQFVFHESLRKHWLNMFSHGLQLIVTGDSHESRLRRIEINEDQLLPVIELSPSSGGKLPSELDLSGRPSALFELTVNKDILNVSKLYFSGIEDSSLRPNGFCRAQKSFIADEIQIDFLLDNNPCNVVYRNKNSANYPVAVTGFGEESYSVFAFDIDFDHVKEIEIDSHDLVKGVILYSSSKAKSEYKVHALKLKQDNQLLTVTLLDRWLREVGKEKFNLKKINFNCSISIKTMGSLLIAGCDTLLEVDINFDSGVYFGTRIVDETATLNSILRFYNPEFFPKFK